MSTSRQENTSLISGSMTRSPYRPKNQGAMRRQRHDQPHGHGQEEREPWARLDEDQRQRERSEEVGHEGRAHEELADVARRKTPLDENRVDDGE
jgi:hypothetical protein